MAYATWLPDVLRAAGVKVVTYPGWATRSSLGKRNPGPAGPLATDRPALLWHHDASPRGDSPGALNWMRSQLLIPGAASANIWVDRYGNWHIIAAGTTWHAGTVSDARWSNFNSIGIETDHTTGEDWPAALLSSLRLGSAAILTHVGRTPADALNFHKHVALPKGSKVDPDGLDLPYERAHLAALIATPTPTRTPALDPLTMEDDMRTITDGTRTGLVGPGYFFELPPGEYAQNAPAIAPLVTGNARQYDLWASMATASVRVTDPAEITAAITKALAGVEGVDAERVAALVADAVLARVVTGARS